MWRFGRFSFAAIGNTFVGALPVGLPASPPYCRCPDPEGQFTAFVDTTSHASLSRSVQGLAC